MKQFMLSIMIGQRQGFWAGLIKLLLYPMSLIYGAGVWCHRRVYDAGLCPTYESIMPVISIGNITVGGTGKTPVVEWVCRQLQHQQLKLVVLTRGYMTQSNVQSDEAMMLQAQLPGVTVMASANRKASIKKALSLSSVDVFICDDGFQHWPLKRDLDIVVVDASNPFGNGHLLPAGILREYPVALRRAQVVILTKTDQANDVQNLQRQIEVINPNALRVNAIYRGGVPKDVFSSNKISLNDIKSYPIVACCAIASPTSFETTLTRLGVKVQRLFNFWDHHSYRSEDIHQILGYCRAYGVKTVITTHKDAVKLQLFKDLFEEIQLVYLPIELIMTKGADEFLQRIIAVSRR